jgi:uncharacterized protein (DUF697 family)
MLNPGKVRKGAERPIRIGLVASNPQAFAEMEEFLVPSAMAPQARRELLKRVHRAGDADAPDAVDLVLYERGLRRNPGTYTFDPRDPDETLKELTADRDELGLALARQFPGFRKGVADRIVQSVARENALFAIATALPNVVPSLVELPWALGEFASDTAFITANQVRMAFLIAAACGKDVGYTQQVAEVVSITAGAFGWRALARELAGKIPLGGGLIAKGAIAYAGTYAVGRGLVYFHHANTHFTRQESDTVYREGLERGRRVAEAAAEKRA